MLWSLTASQNLLYEEFDEAVMCFSPLSGETHLLNHFPAELLHFLSEKPASLDRIAEYLAEQCDVEVDDDWRIKILRLLEELSRLSLVEQL